MDDLFDDFSRLKEAYCSLSISCRNCPFCDDPGCKVHDSPFYEPERY